MPNSLNRQQTLKRFYWLLGIFCLAMVFRCLHLALMSRAPFFEFKFGDAESYDLWAHEIAAGNWIGNDVFYQAPLYPYFLAVIYSTLGDGIMLVRICQAVIGSLSCVLICDTAWRMFSKPAGIAAGLMLAVYAPALFLDSLLEKSVLDVFFICLLMRLMSELIVRNRQIDEERIQHTRPFSKLWLFAGITLGALILVRENASVLVAVIFGWMPFEFRRIGTRRLYLGGAFLLGLAVVLVPVGLRNYAVSNEFHLTTSQLGPNLFIGNNENATGLYQPLIRTRGQWEHERQDAIELAEKAEGRRLNAGEVSRHYIRRVFQFITHHPGAWLRLMGKKFALTWNAMEAVDTQDQYTYTQWSPVLWIGKITHFGVLVPLAVFGVWATWSQRESPLLFVLMIVFYAGSVVVFYVFARYRYPLTPLLIFFAAGGLVKVRSRLREESLSQIATLGALLLAAVIFCNWPLLSVDEMRATTLFNIADEFESRERLDEASEYYQRALRFNDHCNIHLRLGHIYVQQGRLSDARNCFSTATEIHPELSEKFAEGHFRLGLMSMKENSIHAAAEHFKTVVAIQPNSLKAHCNLGAALAMSGNKDHAAKHLREAIRIDPRSVQAHSNLGLLLLEQEKFSEARAHFQRVLDLNPNFELAKEKLMQIDQLLQKTPTMQPKDQGRGEFD